MNLIQNPNVASNSDREGVLLESSGFVESVAIDVGSGCLIFSAILPLHFAAAFAAAAAFFAASARALPSSP